LTLYQRWIFFLLSFTYILSFFYRTSTAVIAPDLMNSFKIGANGLGLLSGVFFYAFAIIQLPLGPALDWVGPKWTVTGLMLLAAIGALIFAVAPSFSYAILGRCLIGIGMASILMGSLKIFTLHFDSSKFATLTGIIVTLGYLGSICATTPLAFLVSHIGWRGSFISIAILNAILSIFIFFSVKDQPLKGVGRKKDDVKVYDDRTNRKIDPLSSSLILLKSKSFWAMSVLEFVRYGSFASIQGLWGGPFLMDGYGLSREFTSILLMMISIGYVLGSPWVGFLSEKIFQSRKKVVLWGVILYSLTILFFLMPFSSTPNIILFLIFLLIGLFNVCSIIVMAHNKELFPIEMSGTALSTVNFFRFAGVAFYQQMMGYLISFYPRVQDSYPIQAFRTAFLFCFISLIIGIISYSFVEDTFHAKGGKVQS